MLPAARPLEVRIHGPLHTGFTVYTLGAGQAIQTKTEVCRSSPVGSAEFLTGARTCRVGKGGRDYVFVSTDTHALSNAGLATRHV